MAATMTETKEQALAIELWEQWNRRKFEDRDLMNMQALCVAGAQYIASYTGDFDFVLDLKYKQTAGKKISVGQLRGALNTMVAGVKQAEKRKVEQAQVATQPGNEWVGKVKDKVQFNATVTGLKWITSQFGESLMVKLVDTDGHSFVWFASNEPAALAAGISTKVNVKGTVKGHSEFNGRKETQLTRCKVEYAN